MHHFDANFPKCPGGDPPDPSPTLPLSALRASVKPLASLITSAPPGNGGSGSAPATTSPLFLLKAITDIT